MILLFKLSNYYISCLFLKVFVPLSYNSNNYLNFTSSVRFLDYSKVVNKFDELSKYVLESYLCTKKSWFRMIQDLRPELNSQVSDNSLQKLKKQ